MLVLLNIKGAEKCLFVCASNQNHYHESPPIRMVPPGVAFLLGCTSTGTVCVYSTGMHRVL